MAETTHEALLRQVGATEEMLAYFQGQRDQFNANVADAQAGYDDLASDLVGILNDRTSFLTFYDPDASDNNHVRGGHFKDWSGLKDLITQLPNNAAIHVILPRNSVLLVTGSFSSSDAFSVNLYFEASGSKTIVADSPIIRLQAYDGVSFSQYRSIDIGSKGSLEAQGVVFEWEAPIDAGVPFSSNTFAVSFRSENTVRLTNCKIKNEYGRAFSRAATGSIARLSLHSVEIDGAGVMALKRDAAASLAILSVGTVTLTNGAVVHHDTFTRGSDLFTNYVQV
jgi:hypothetical protein